MKYWLSKYRTLPVALKASFWFLICSFMQKGIAMLTTPIFTRMLTSAEYGKYNVFNSWLSILSIFITLNLSSGVYTQGLVKFDNERSIFSSALQGITLILVFIFLGVYMIFRPFFNDYMSLSTVQVLLMLIIIWTNATFGFWASEQRVDYKYKALVILTIAASIANPVIGIWLISRSTDKVTARIFAIVIVQLLLFSGCFISQIRRGKKIFSAKYWKYAVGFNIPLIPHYLSQTVLNNSDRIMIDSIVGANEAGIYSLAYSVAMIMTLFSQALIQTLNPWCYQKIKQRKIMELETVSYMSLGIMAVATMIMIAFAPEAVAIFAPSQYSGAVYCIPPVAMGMFFLFTFEIFGKFAFYYEKTKSIMYASVGAAVLNILLNCFGIRWFGYMAAAYTTLICYILFSVFHYMLMKRVCIEYCDGVVPMRVKILLWFAVGVLSGGFLMMATYSNRWIRYSVIGIILIVAIIRYKDIKKVLMNVWNLKKGS